MTSQPAISEPSHTLDGFLGGRLTIAQPRHGYRAGVDPVLLAAAVPARAGESALDLGCGVGTAVLCLGARVEDMRLCGLERQADYAALARQNAARNGIAVEVVEGDLARMPAMLKTESFDHVIANPPYFRADGRTGAADAGREAALAEETPLSAWCDAALRRLKPGGWLTMIHAAERLPDILSALSARTGGVSVLPLIPRPGRPATRVIIRARKGSRAAFTLRAPVALHDGPAHLRDGEDYTPDIRDVLRNAAPLSHNNN